MILYDKYGYLIVWRLAAFTIVMVSVAFLALWHLEGQIDETDRAETQRQREQEERLQRIDSRTERIERLLSDGGAP